MKKCNYCGHMCPDNDVWCESCNRPLTPQTPPPPYGSNYSYPQGYDRNNAFDEGPEGKSRGVAALLAIFLGGLGVQYFYLGKVGGGLLTILLSLVTCGLWEIVTLIQGILMFCMSNADFRRKYVLSTSTLPLF
ncbi:MAG: TM2 domain-containing protein [Muribaculaceae bacterium]|nr:TM2 domain-containing protein [Muribaculaceae bacterium]